MHSPRIQLPHLYVSACVVIMECDNASKKNGRCVKTLIVFQIVKELSCVCV